MEMRTFTDSAGTSLPYRIYIPPEAGEGEKLPLLLYLHGAGHRGDDNTTQVYFEPGILSRVLRSEYKNCILVAPQCPDEMQWVDTPWEAGSYSLDSVPMSRSLGATYELLLSLIKSEPVDSDRIYVTGLSMGGYGTWDIILRHPELSLRRFPICGAGDPSKADVIAELPVWFSTARSTRWCRYQARAIWHRHLKKRAARFILILSIPASGTTVGTRPTPNPTCSAGCFHSRNRAAARRPPPAVPPDSNGNISRRSRSLQPGLARPGRLRLHSGETKNKGFHGVSA